MGSRVPPSISRPRRWRAVAQEIETLGHGNDLDPVRRRYRQLIGEFAKVRRFCLRWPDSSLASRPEGR